MTKVSVYDFKVNILTYNSILHQEEYVLLTSELLSNLKPSYAINIAHICYMHYRLSLGHALDRQKFK